MDRVSLDKFLDGALTDAAKPADLDGLNLPAQNKTPQTLGLHPHQGCGLRNTAQWTQIRCIAVCVCHVPQNALAFREDEANNETHSFGEFVRAIIMNENSDIVIGDPETSFNGFLSVLNDKKNAIRREEMRRLFEAWRSSGPSVEKLLRANPELRAYVYGEHGVPMWRAIPHPEGSGIRLEIQPLSPSRVMTREELSRDYTRRIFMHFLMSPLRDQILGPCARCNCGQYFRRRRKADTKYCSRRCAQLQAGANSAEERRNDERDGKVRTAAELASKWARARTTDEWKQWVSKQPAGVKKEITPKFLTRAVNHYGLVPPKKGR
jgi:hypothetical protein